MEFNFKTLHRGPFLEGVLTRLDESTRTILLDVLQDADQRLATLEATQTAPLADAALQELERRATLATQYWNAYHSLEHLPKDEREKIASNRFAFLRASQPKEVLALLARLRDSELENEGLHQLSQRQAKILSATAIALRGPEPPLTMWSHHDVAELAADAMARLRAAEATKWIAVSDQLPAPKQNVLAVLTTGSQVAVTYKGGEWRTGLGTNYATEYVTHWQPELAGPETVKAGQPNA